MNTRGRTIIDRGNTFVIRGYGARDLANSAGIRVIYNGVAQGFVGDGWRLPDLLASLDRRHVGYTLERQVPVLPPSEVPSTTTTPEPEWDLFGGDVA